jgi:hypothetical protein
VPIEALGKLKYAGELADVSLEQLSTGLRKLSVNMLTVAQTGKGPAAEAFKALGVSVSDATGRLRPGQDVLADVAEASPTWPTARPEDRAGRADLRQVRRRADPAAERGPRRPEGDGRRGRPARPDHRPEDRHRRRGLQRQPHPAAAEDATKKFDDELKRVLDRLKTPSERTGAGTTGNGGFLEKAYKAGKLTYAQYYEQLHRLYPAIVSVTDAVKPFSDEVNDSADALDNAADRMRDTRTEAEKLADAFTSAGDSFFAHGPRVKVGRPELCGSRL